MLQKACLVVVLAAPATLGYSNVKLSVPGQKVSSVVIGDSCFECPNFHYCACIENSQYQPTGERFLFEGKSCSELKYTNRQQERSQAFPVATHYLADKISEEKPAQLQANTCSKECAEDSTQCGSGGLQALIEMDVQQEQHNEEKAKERRCEWYRRSLRQRAKEE